MSVGWASCTFVWVGIIAMSLLFLVVLMFVLLLLVAAGGGRGEGGEGTMDVEACWVSGGRKDIP